MTIRAVTLTLLLSLAIIGTSCQPVPTPAGSLPSPTGLSSSPTAVAPLPKVTPSPALLPSVTVEMPSQGHPTPTAPPRSAATPTPSSFSFAVLGDNRNGDATYSRLLAMLNQDSVAFLIHTGDMVPVGLPDYFRDFQGLMRLWQRPFYPVPGNHDLGNDGSLTNYLRYSGAPAPHYSFDYGQVHFTLANSSQGELTAGEIAWLEADLAATKQPVRVVVLHHPPFDPLGGSHILRRGNTELMALATKYKVRYVFAGHIHQYARAVKDGVIYIITGGAGAPLYAPPDKGGFYHYVRVTVWGTETKDEVIRLP